MGATDPTAFGIQHSASAIVDADPGATPVRFAEKLLGMTLYPWQAKALMTLVLASGRAARLVLQREPMRVKASVCAPNGAGKDQRLIAVAALWWIYKHPTGTVVITSKSDLQISQQTIPAIEAHRQKFEGWESVNSPRYELTTPTGGRIIAFVTNNAANVEGWHKKDDVDGPLLYIVNEAKSVDESVFEAVDRCTWNALFYASSPGVMMGRFFDSHSKLRADFFTIQAGLADCPHIPREKIEDIVRTYGADHPFTRSTLHGEFMAEDDTNRFVVSLASLLRCLDNPPAHRPGLRAGFCDFADGGAENVFGVRDGNKLEIRAAWREKNPHAVAGRFIREFVASGLKPEEISGDAAGKQILDLLAEAGWAIQRQSFGAPATNDDVYKSWVAESWFEFSTGIERCEWILPNDDALKAQLTTRQKSLNARGKLCLEDKADLAKRNIPSPDRADVMIGLARARDFSLLHRTGLGLGGLFNQFEAETNSGILAGIGADAGW